MAKIENIHVIEVSPEKFLRVCSDTELAEIWLLLQSKEFGSRIVIDDDPVGNDYMKDIKKICAEIEGK